MPDAASDFDVLVEEFYAVWLPHHPHLALAAGVPLRGPPLPAQDDDEVGALAGWIESLLLGLDEVDCRALDPDRRLDYALLAGFARLEHRELWFLDGRHRDPRRFLPLAEIHHLTLEPSDGVRGWLAQLLAGVPEHLRLAQGQLSDGAEALAPTLVRVAARETEDGRCYLRGLIRGPWLRRNCHGLAELESLAELACEALAGFRDVLTHELLPRATGALGCGEPHLMRRLAELHFLEVDGNQAGRALARALAQVDEAIGQCPLVTEGGAPAVPRERPSAPALLDPLTGLEALRQEISASGLVTLPARPLRVEVRPQCPGLLRWAPTYRAQGPAAGTLYVPAGGSTLDPEAQRARCASAGWGGEHLLAWTDRARASRMPRRLANGISLLWGWHLYLDDLLARRAGSDPGRRLASLRRQRERLVLAQLDLGIHCGSIAADQGREALACLGEEGPAAEARLAEIARTPGDALAGALGWLLLGAAREALEAEEGRHFVPRDFHRRLLSQGQVPLPLVLGFAFGEPLWRGVRREVLGP